VVFSLLVGAAWINQPVANAQEDTPQLSDQEYEPDQKSRIAVRLLETGTEEVVLKAKEPTKAERPTYYLSVRSYGLTRESEPPRYVR